MIKVCFVEKPVILCAPEPRSLALIFTVEHLKVLQAGYQLIEVEQDDIANLSPDILAQVSYIIGQPSLWNGLADNPAPLTKLPSGLLAQP